MDKKEILKALGEYFGVKPKYLGAPSFAYQIINNQGEIIIVDVNKVLLKRHLVLKKT